MEPDAEKSENGEREFQPLENGPREYVGFLFVGLLSADWAQLPRRSVPAYQDRPSPRQVLQDIREGGEGVRYAIRQEI